MDNSKKLGVSDLKKITYLYDVKLILVWLLLYLSHFAKPIMHTTNPTDSKKSC